VTGTAWPSPSASQRPDLANGIVKTKRSWLHGILYFCVHASVRMGIDRIQSRQALPRQRKEKREAAMAACADGEVHAQV
jgi:hypothetical protein